jgi:hypothetical protein
LYKWLIVIISLIKKYCEAYKKRKNDKKTKTRRERKEYKGNCVPINSPVYYKPDPMIYSQSYLMKQGLAVTWDNPDIQLYKDGQPVSSAAILPDTEYEIAARIWNASYDAPVVGMPVKFSYLDFGAGTISKYIGQTFTSLGIIGGSDNPNFARVKWRTPAVEGHYCIQVKLEWADDKNPENNLGQENTNVVAAHSPAFFDFTVHNENRKSHRYHFEVDTYEIPKQRKCGEFKNRESDNKKYLLALHDRKKYTIPNGWDVEFDPTTFGLLPNEEIKIKVKITPPENFKGIQPFNINVFDELNNMTGGVTVYIEKK